MQDVVLGRHHLQLLPERALYWPAYGMLLLADLHLGKADTFRHFGISVPQGVQTHDLERLHTALQQCSAQRCVVLGDFVHGRTVSDDTAHAWHALQQAHPYTCFELVIGNHDRTFNPQQLHMHAVYEHLQLDDVLLTHEPVAPADWPAASVQWNMHGHLHPIMRLPGSRIAHPVLALQAPYVRLPALSAFTAGQPVHGACQGLWALHSEEGVVVRLC